MVAIDHIGLDARDPRRSAEALAEILGVGAPSPDGADDDMFRVDLAGSFLLFAFAAEVKPQHIAFRASTSAFADILARLLARNIPYGNDPEQPDNGRSDDPLGGAGRIYWLDQNLHLFEATC